MMLISQFAQDVCDYLCTLPEVRQCGLYGSLKRNCFDQYSDIDIELEAAPGVDNGQFLLSLPQLIAKKYPIIFCDYAPSLAPEQYLVTVAIHEKNPFLLVDITCTSEKPCKSVSKEELRGRNNLYDHTLKLFAANLKHYLRGTDCERDIQKMYQRIFPQNTGHLEEREMLSDVYHWLEAHREKRHESYLKAFQDYLPFSGE